MAATKTFKYRGEDFEVSKPVDCVLKVAGKGRTAQVSVKGDKFVIQVLGTQDNGQLYSRTTDLISAACERILAHLPSTQKQLCDDMTVAFDKLNG